MRRRGSRESESSTNQRGEGMNMIAYPGLRKGREHLCEEDDGGKHQEWTPGTTEGEGSL